MLHTGASQNDRAYRAKTMSQEGANILLLLCLLKIKDCSTYVAIPKCRKPLIYEISTSFYHDS